MEYWNDGLPWRDAYVNCCYTCNDGTDQFIKSDLHPLSVPNIPLFHHSIIPFGV
ncbi:hypothetical protein D1AOALGA4SA_570 [Olavius algarvensis Delta 1 endosymbiont]|nr:hypothetical protein D1AOALGA4SA_570 [Olavius algarvensis Delta 1 endosymbiont]